MTDTPRTNAAMFAVVPHSQSGAEWVVKMEVAQDLERQLDQTQCQVAALEAGHEGDLSACYNVIRDFQGRVAALEAERDLLLREWRAERAEQMEHHAQTLAVRDKTWEELNAARQRITELEASKRKP